MAEILVTGATGKTGRQVALQLAGRPGVDVRPASRPGFDWHDPGTWSATVGAASAAYLVRPDLPNAPELIGEFLDAAPGLRRVVLLSEIGAERAAPASWERRVEAAVTERPVAWTILRPTWFMQVLTDPAFYRDGIRDDGVIRLPSGGAAISFVDARDIAAVAVAALTDAAHAGRAYPVTGPEALPVADVAARIAAVAGRPVRHLDPPVADAVAGTEPWLAAVLSRVYERVRSGVAGEVTDVVEQVSGRPARTLDAFLGEHRSAWVSAS
jgi:uncharacterized protein YbjT (DUF2867 family)